MSDRIALLVDAENISVKYVDVAIKELKQYGIIAVQRMYGDFSRDAMKEWSKRGLEYAIVPIHQSRYTASKNASDIMLVIDAMDILSQGIADVFCLVTSDSDFTRLASRLREGGKKVVGMGLSNASKAFITACNEYKFLDKIIEGDNEEEIIEDSAVTPLTDIKRALNVMLQQAENKGELLNLGSTKSQLQREFPDFDERNYGYSLFRKFIEEETKYQVVVEGSTAFIQRKNLEKKNETEDVVSFVIKCAKTNMDLGRLGKEIHNKYPNFKLKELGYSKLSKYVQSIPGVALNNKNNASHVSFENNGK